MSSPLAVGIVGCGWMGEEHAARYAALETANVVASADFNPTAREAVAREYEIDATYETHAELLADAEIDLLSICTWQGTHARITIDACESGVSGVLCEKPMATNVGEARDMLDAAERNDVTFVVGHQRRFAPISEQVRAQIQDGAIGTPHLIRGSAGDGLLNWGTHIIDLSRYILGDPDPVWVAGHVERQTDRYERGVPTEDRCLGTVAFEGGPRLVLEMDMPDPDPASSRMQCYGSDGVIELDLGRRATIVTESGRSEIVDESEFTAEQSDLIEAFVAYTNGDREDHRCDASHALHTMDIMMGLYESVRRNEVITLPLTTRENPLELLIEGRLAPEYPGRYDIRRPYESIRSSGDPS